MSRALATRPQPADPQPAPDLSTLVVRAAAELAWGARHPDEPFAERPDGTPAERRYYAAADGWEAPLWRYPPRPGATGEPLVLAHGLGINRHSLDFRGDRSLARAAWRRGYDVYLLEHRGDRHAVAPPGARPFDFDDIVDLDLPAAIDRVRDLSGADRVLWAGHALGGQVLYGHLARGGSRTVAAGVTLCAAARFEVPASTARLATAAARLLPGGWQIPARVLHRALAPLGAPPAWRALVDSGNGPARRGLMLHGVDDLHLGLVRQVARWVGSGHLCDRDDRFDYVAALAGVRCPVMVLAAAGDAVCPPAAARPAAEALPARSVRWEQLDGSWGHLDPLVSDRAARRVYPAVLDWLEEHRSACWTAET